MRNFNPVDILNYKYKGMIRRKNCILITMEIKTSHGIYCDHAMRV